MEEIKNIEYRIKQKGNMFYPQYKYGIRTMWSFENVTDSYETFVKLNNITTNNLTMDNMLNHWTIYFYDFDSANNYIENVLKEKHFKQYYKKITKIK